MTYKWRIITSLGTFYTDDEGCLKLQGETYRPVWIMAVQAEWSGAKKPTKTYLPDSMECIVQEIDHGQ